MNKYIIVALCLLSISCSKYNEALSKTFDVSSGTVDLSKQLQGNWDKVCLLTPYSNNESAENILGFKFNVEEKSNIFVSDSITLVVAVKGNEVLKYFEVPRSNIDLASIDASCYTKDNAKFKIKNSNNSWHIVEHT